MNDILQKTPGESANNPWQLRAFILPNEYSETAEERFPSDLEGPFLVGAPNEIERDVEAEEPMLEIGAPTETLEEPQAAEAWESAENLPAEAPPPIFESAAEFEGPSWLESAVQPAEAEVADSSEAEWLETEWLETPGGSDALSVEAFAERLGREWSRRRGGDPAPEPMRAWLLQDHADTLAGARLRWSGRRLAPDFWSRLTRAWMISREEQMRFHLDRPATVAGLGAFAPPAKHVALVRDPLVSGSDVAPVAPLTVRFARELKRRFGAVDISNYRGHGGGAFLDRGYSLDLFLTGRDPRGFYKPEDAKRLLRAVHAAAGAVGTDWRTIYNDFSVADAINRELKRNHVIFVGSVTRNKAKHVTGLNWHGPDPLILHVHLDLAPRPGAPLWEAEVAYETTAHLCPTCGGAHEGLAETADFDSQAMESLETEEGFDADEAEAPGRFDAPDADAEWEQEREAAPWQGFAGEAPAPKAAAPSELASAGLSSAERLALEITSTLETGKRGGFFGLSGNFDGQGLSFGLVNWTIGTGSLQPLLRDFAREQPARWATVFGPNAEHFRRVITPKGDAAVREQLRFAVEEMNAVREVNGRKQWAIRPPWSGYFRKLSEEPAFRAIQIRYVRDLQARAAYFCRLFKLKSQQAFAFMFDAVSSHGKWWLTRKIGGVEKRRVLIDQRLVPLRLAFGEDRIPERQVLLVIADVLAETSAARWAEKVRVRKRWFVTAQHPRARELAGLEPRADVPWTTSAPTGAKEVGEELAWLESAVQSAEAETADGSEAEWLETEWLDTPGGSDALSVEAFAERFSREWSRRRGGDPAPEPMRAWQLRAPILPTEYRETAEERFSSDLEGPFLVGAPNEIERDTEAEDPALEIGPPTETLEELQAAEAWESMGNLAAETPPPIFESAAEFDPYAGIRPALSPEHGALTADEITAVLGPRPAIIALHELLSQPELPRAALAILLGNTGRRSISVNGADIPIAVYLRQLSQLCREAADYHDMELGTAPLESEVPATRAWAGATTSTGAPPRAVSGWPLGVDLYSGQKMDAAAFTNLKRQGKVFAIVKSSQGTVRDSKFLTYYKMAKDSGLIRGSYHFFANKWGGAAQPWLHGAIADQAKAVITLVKRLGPGDLAPALDLEDEPRGAANSPKRYPLDQGITPAQRGYHYRRTKDNPQWRLGVDALLTDIRTFLTIVETALGRTPMIYTSHMWRDSDMMNDPKVMSQHPLWTVYHGERDLTTIKVGAWGNNWDFIQYAEDGKNYWGLRPYHEPNISITGIDFTAYNGTIYGLRGLADIGRVGIAITGAFRCIAHSGLDGHQHLLVGPNWTDHDLSRNRVPGGSDPALLAAANALYLYFRDGDHIVEAMASGPTASTWTSNQIDRPGDAKPVHDPRAAASGSNRYVCYWGDDDDWYLLTLGGARPSSYRVLSSANIKPSTDQGRSTGQPAIFVSQGAVHLIGRVGSEGHLFDIWTDGRGNWRKDDVTALARDVAPAMPPATYSPCAYETSSGVGIVFRAVGGDIWVVTRRQNAPTNLMAATRATSAAGHPACFVLSDIPHILYRGTDRSLHEIWLDSGIWKTRQICNVKAAADPTATTDGSIGLVAVRATDGIIHAAQFDGRNWTCAPTVAAV